MILGAFLLHYTNTAVGWTWRLFELQSIEPKIFKSEGVVKKNCCLFFFDFSKYNARAFLWASDIFMQYSSCGWKKTATSPNIFFSLFSANSSKLPCSFYVHALPALGFSTAGYTVYAASYPFIFRHPSYDHHHHCLDPGGGGYSYPSS